MVSEGRCCCLCWGCEMWCSSDVGTAGARTMQNGGGLVMMLLPAWES